MDDAMHLVIAIPTFNRCEKLKKNLECFDKQQTPKDVKISVAISNSASTDHTEQFLNKLDNERSNVFIFNQQTNWTGGNYGFLEAVLPHDADWIWYMGDDDHFPGTTSLLKMCEFLGQHETDQELVFVHACQARRSRGSGLICKSDVLSLCNHFGYIEMLGWISSIVMRVQPFRNALQKIDKRVQIARTEPLLGNSQSAFFHSSFLLEEIHNKKGAFIDFPFVEPQDKSMTEDTRQRWQNENMGERYIYVVDDLERLKELGIPLKDLRPSFFKYHKYHLWDRFLIHQLSTLDAFGRGDKTDLVAVSMQRFVKNWERISKIIPLIEGATNRKNLTIQFEIAIGLCNLYVEKNFDPLIREMITRQIELSSIETYDFNINQQPLNN
jgi:glycosyltransferase involved in cell wall biosynthesis